MNFSIFSSHFFDKLINFSSFFIILSWNLKLFKLPQFFISSEFPISHFKVFSNIFSQIGIGPSIIVLLLHLGVECEIDIEIKLKLGLYDKDSKFDECRKNDELYELLSKFNDDNKYFDVIISGHSHETVHQWIKGYPVISNIDQGKYFNLMYLYFNKILFFSSIFLITCFNPEEG